MFLKFGGQIFFGSREVLDLSAFFFVDDSDLGR